MKRRGPQTVTGRVAHMLWVVVADHPLVAQLGEWHRAQLAACIAQAAAKQYLMPDAFDIADGVNALHAIAQTFSPAWTASVRLPKEWRRVVQVTQRLIQSSRTRQFARNS